MERGGCKQELLLLWLANTTEKKQQKITHLWGWGVVFVCVCVTSLTSQHCATCTPKQILTRALHFMPVVRRIVQVNNSLVVRFSAKLLYIVHFYVYTVMPWRTTPLIPLTILSSRFKSSFRIEMNRNAINLFQLPQKAHQ